MRKILATLALCTLFASTTVTMLWAQDATDEPTPTAEVTEAAPVGDVTVVVEAPAPVEPAPDTTTPAFLLTALIFGGLALFGWQAHVHNLNLDIVAKTTPPEFAQFAFRMGMEQALKTPEDWDDNAIKTAATQLGYEVVNDGRGGWTIVASASKVAANVVTAQAANEVAVKKGQY